MNAQETKPTAPVVPAAPTAVSPAAAARSPSSAPTAVPLRAAATAVSPAAAAPSPSSAPTAVQLRAAAIAVSPAAAPGSPSSAPTAVPLPTAASAATPAAAPGSPSSAPTAVPLPAAVSAATPAAAPGSPSSAPTAVPLPAAACAATAAAAPRLQSSAPTAVPLPAAASAATSAAAARSPSSTPTTAQAPAQVCTPPAAAPAAQPPASTAPAPRSKSAAKAATAGAEVAQAPFKFMRCSSASPSAAPFRNPFVAPSARTASCETAVSPAPSSAAALSQRRTAPQAAAAAQAQAAGPVASPVPSQTPAPVPAQTSAPVTSTVATGSHIPRHDSAFWRGRTGTVPFKVLPPLVHFIRHTHFEHDDEHEQPSEAEYAEHMLNVSKLSGVHVWDTNIIRRPAFNRETQGSFLRPDMQLFATMVGRHGHNATMENWRDMCKAHKFMYKIPSSIKVDRTFVRDELEAIYVDWMDAFLGRQLLRAEPVDLRTLPLLSIGDSLMTRWWHKFSKQRLFALEAEWRERYNIMLPMTIVNMPITDAYRKELQKLYPPTQSWYRGHHFPAGVPAPTPPCVFYWHLEMMQHIAPGKPHTRERGMWERILAIEWAVLYIASWWHEAARGGRAHVVPKDTIAWLQDTIGDEIAIDAETFHGPNNQTTTGHVFRCMYKAAAARRKYHNYVHFKKTSLPKSAFVHCINNTGVLNLLMPSQTNYIRCAAGKGRLQNLDAPCDSQGYRMRWSHAKDVEYNTIVDEDLPAFTDDHHPAGLQHRPHQRRRLHSPPRAPHPRHCPPPASARHWPAELPANHRAPSPPPRHYSARYAHRAPSPPRGPPAPPPYSPRSPSPPRGPHEPYPYAPRTPSPPRVPLQSYPCAPCASSAPRSPPCSYPYELRAPSPPHCPPHSYPYDSRALSPPRGPPEPNKYAHRTPSPPRGPTQSYLYAHRARTPPRGPPPPSYQYAQRAPSPPCGPPQPPAYTARGPLSPRGQPQPQAYSARAPPPRDPPHAEAYAARTPSPQRGPPAPYPHRVHSPHARPGPNRAPSPLRAPLLANFDPNHPLERVPLNKRADRGMHQSEPGREELTLDEWRQRGFPEPTQQDWDDARWLLGRNDGPNRRGGINKRIRPRIVMHNRHIVARDNSPGGPRWSHQTQ